MGKSCSKSSSGANRISRNPFASDWQQQVAYLYLKHFIPLSLVESGGVFARLLLRDQSESRVFIAGSRAEGLAIPDCRLATGTSILAAIDVINNVGFHWSKIAGWNIVQSRLEELMIRDAVALISLCVDHHAFLEPAVGAPRNYAYISDRNSREDHASNVFVRRKGDDAWYLSSVKLNCKAKKLGQDALCTGDTLLNAWDDVSESSSSDENETTKSPKVDNASTKETSAEDNNEIPPAVRARLPFLPRDVSPPSPCCLAYPLSSWPDVAHAFLDRHRSSGWPSTHTLQLIADLSPAVFVVSQGSLQGQDPDLQWRYCFAPVEVTLAQSLNRTHKVALIHFKLLSHFFFNFGDLDFGVGSHQGSRNYCLKTIFMWELEHLPEDTWLEANLPGLLIHLLKTLQKALMRGKLPDYFIPEHNLLAHMKSSDGKKFAAEVKYAIDNLFQCFMHISKQVEYFHDMGNTRADFEGLLQVAIDPTRLISDAALRELTVTLKAVIHLYIDTLKVKTSEILDLCKARRWTKRGATDAASLSTWDSVASESSYQGLGEDQQEKITADLFNATFCVNNLFAEVCELLQELFMQNCGTTDTKRESLQDVIDLEGFAGKVLVEDLDLEPPIIVRLLLVLYVARNMPLSVMAWQAWLFGTIGCYGSKRDALFYESYNLVQTDLDLLWVAGLPSEQLGQVTESQLTLAPSEQSSMDDLSSKVEAPANSIRASIIMDDVRGADVSYFQFNSPFIRKILNHYYRNDKWLALPAFHNISLSLLFKSGEFY